MSGDPARAGVPGLPVLVAGGGIGGLVLALMLHARGVDCRVLEAAAEVRPLGVGINVLPHSIRELAALGLLPRLDALAIRTRRLTYANHLGQPIWTEPRGLGAGHEVPQFSAHRGRLHRLLWDAAVERLGAGAVQAGWRLTGFKEDARRVTARFAAPDGTAREVDGAALVGADGIHSALRALLHPEDPGVRWNGIQMWRGAVDWPAFDGGDAMVVAGDSVAKLVLYPIAPGTAPGLCPARRLRGGADCGARVAGIPAVKALAEVQLLTAPIEAYGHLFDCVTGWVEPSGRLRPLLLRHREERSDAAIQGGGVVRAVPGLPRRMGSSQ